MAARLIVERVASVWRRPWVMATGRLEGGPLRAGDTISISYGEHPVAVTVIRSIEVHGPAGMVTIAVDREHEALLGPGAVISKAV
jgi:hypothetical protein